MIGGGNEEGVIAAVAAKPEASSSRSAESRAEMSAPFQIQVMLVSAFVFRKKTKVGWRSRHPILDSVSLGETLSLSFLSSRRGMGPMIQSVCLH